MVLWSIDMLDKRPTAAAIGGSSITSSEEVNKPIKLPPQEGDAGDDAVSATMAEPSANENPNPLVDSPGSNSTNSNRSKVRWTLSNMDDDDNEKKSNIEYPQQTTVEAHHLQFLALKKREAVAVNIKKMLSLHHSEPVMPGTSKTNVDDSSWLEETIAESEDEEEEEEWIEQTIQGDDEGQEGEEYEEEVVEDEEHDYVMEPVVRRLSGGWVEDLFWIHTSGAAVEDGAGHYLHGDSHSIVSGLTAWDSVLHDSSKDEDEEQYASCDLHKHVQGADWKGLSRTLKELIQKQQQSPKIKDIYVDGNDAATDVQQVSLRQAILRRNKRAETALHVICSQAPSRIALRLLTVLQDEQEKNNNYSDSIQQLLITTFDSAENTVLHTVCATIISKRNSNKSYEDSATKKKHSRRRSSSHHRRSSGSGSSSSSKRHHRSRRSSHRRSSSKRNLKSTQIPELEAVAEAAASVSSDNHTETTDENHPFIDECSSPKFNASSGELSSGSGSGAAAAQESSTAGNGDEDGEEEEEDEEDFEDDELSARQAVLDFGILHKLVDLAPEMLAMTNTFGDTPLHLLVTSPGFCQLKFKGESGEVQIAAEMAAEEALQVLLDLLPQEIAMQTNLQGLTLLHGAIAQGAHERVLVQLLKRLPQAASLPDAQGLYPLHYAALKAADIPWTFCQELIAAHPPALVAKTFEFGDTPLHLLLSHARKMKREHDKKQHYRNKHRKSSSSNSSSRCKQEFFLNRNTTKIAEMLSQRIQDNTVSLATVQRNGNDNNNNNSTNQEVPECALLVFNQQQLTPLHSCAHTDTPDRLIRILTASQDMTSRASVLQSPNMKSTPMHLACARRSSTACLAVIQALAAFSDAFALQDCQGRTPLAVAALNPDVASSVIKLLVDKYPPAVDIPCHGNYLPLHLAIQAQHKDSLIRQLIQASPQKSLRAITNQGETPLHIACSQPDCSIRLVKQLLDGYREAAFLRNVHGKSPGDLCYTFNPHFCQQIPLLGVSLGCDDDDEEEDEQDEVELVNPIKAFVMLSRSTGGGGILRRSTFMVGPEL